MPDMHLNEDERALVAQVRSFAQECFSESNVARWCKQAGLPDDVVKAFVHLDFKGFGVVSRRNGLHYDLFAQVLVIEELCRAAACALPFANDFLLARLLGTFAAPEQSDALFSEYLATGRMPASNAATLLMGGEADPRNGIVCGTVDGAKIMAGEKSGVVNGEFSPLTLVRALDLDESASAGSERFSLWLIPASHGGVAWTPQRKAGQDMLPFANLKVSKLALQPAWEMRGAATRETFAQCLDFSRVYVCAAALGEAQAAVFDAARWVASQNARVASVDSSTSQLLCDMEIALSNMRYVVYRVARALDLGQGDEAGIALMKRYVPQAAVHVATCAMQVIGGEVYTQQQRVSRIWRDCKGYQFLEGDERAMAALAVPRILEKYASRER